MFKKSKIIFNIHLFLTFLSVLPLIIMSVSGAFLQYRTEIANFINKDAFDIRSGENHKSLEQLLNDIKHQNGEFGIRNFKLYNNGNSAQILIQNERSRYGYILYPNSAEIKDDLGTNLAFTLMMLHRNLALSMSEDKNLAFIGKHIVAISSISLALLVVSGIWLYMPLIRKNFIKALKFNKKAKGFALFYQLHSSFGLWLGALLLVMSLTGLFWSYDFVRNSVFWAFGVEKQMMKHKSSNENSKVDFKDYDKILNLVPKFDVLTILRSADNYSLIIKNGKQEQKAMIDVDKNELKFLENDSKKIKTQTKVEQKLNARDVSRVMLSIHEGKIFGELGRALFSFTCIMINFFIITGFVMTFKRVNKRHKV